MTKVNFKFGLDEEVTTSDGMEGKIASMCFEKGQNFYNVRIPNFDWQYLPERELLAGWGLFQHTMKK